jgi:hypothetical protein
MYYFVYSCATNNTSFVRFQVLTAVVMKSSIFWDITPCSPLKFDQRTIRRYIPEDSTLQHIFSYMNTQLLDGKEIACKGKAFGQGERLLARLSPHTFWRNLRLVTRYWPSAVFTSRRLI